MKYWKYITVILVAISVGLIIIGVNKNSITRVEIVSLQYNASLEITSTKKIAKMLTESRITSVSSSNQLDFLYLLRVEGEKGIENYFFFDSSFLFNRGQIIEPTSELKELLIKSMQEVSKSSPFGQLISWEEVNTIFPRMAKAKLRDLETGLVFNIQRRGGSAHADVQPLSAQDTEILKKIYGGRWSWKRRAAILEKDGYLVAASMNGMPHGQGAIPNNNFPGHFCLHFNETKTHSGNSDLAHALMTRKAAGCIEEYLMHKTPPEIIEIAFTAVAQNDPQLVVHTFVLKENIGQLLEHMKNIANLKITNIKEVFPNNEYMVEINWYENGKGKNNKKEFSVFIEKTKDSNKFLVRSDEIIKALLEE